MFSDTYFSVLIVFTMSKTPTGRHLELRFKKRSSSVIKISVWMNVAAMGPKLDVIKIKLYSQESMTQHVFVRMK